MRNKLFNGSGLKYFLLIILIVSLVLINRTFDINIINTFLEESQSQIGRNGFYILLSIFMLRSISIVIPMVPGTYCAVIAGYIYGIQKGMLVMFIADFLSCSLSFLISRKLGRGFVKSLLGAKQMQKIEKISQKYLENNFFLMTGFLMTSWFDFVCYAVGLTKLTLKKFLPALILSILISDLPFVAGGYTIREIQGVSISQIISGEVSVIKGPYLLILIFSALIIFCLGLINTFINNDNRLKKSNRI